MKRNILILIQAPADIQYALDLYLKYCETHEITMVCINVRNISTYLNTLNLKKCNIFYTLPKFRTENLFPLVYKIHFLKNC